MKRLEGVEAPELPRLQVVSELVEVQVEADQGVHDGPGLPSTDFAENTRADVLGT